MDIEGAEPFALIGATKCLEKENPPVWQIEMAGYSKRHGIPTSKLIEMLKKRGYFCALYDPDNSELVSTCRPWIQNVHNVLAISESKRDFVMERLEGKRSIWSTGGAGRTAVR